MLKKLKKMQLAKLYRQIMYVCCVMILLNFVLHALHIPFAQNAKNNIFCI